MANLITKKELMKVFWRSQLCQMSHNYERMQSLSTVYILKPVLIDRLVLSLCRHKSLKDEYFDYKKDRCYLNKEGVKFFVEKYENYLLKTIKINNKYYSYRNLISREVHLLSNYIANESNDYKPYIMKW